MNAIEILCKNNIKNQDYCCDKGVLASLINLLQFNSGILKKINTNYDLIKMLNLYL